MLRKGLIENCSHKNQNSNIILLHSDLKKSFNPLDFLIIFHKYSQNEIVLIIYDLTNLRWGWNIIHHILCISINYMMCPPCWLLVGNFMRNLSHKFASVVMWASLISSVIIICKILKSFPLIYSHNGSARAAAAEAVSLGRLEVEHWAARVMIQYDMTKWVFLK